MITQVTEVPAPGPIIQGVSPIPEWVAPFLAVVLLIIVGGILLLPLVRAWAKRIEGRGGDPMVGEELAQLRERVAELEHSGARVAELEERVDFAERLLAQRGDVQHFPLHRTPV